jgi:hypothetical protein
MDVRSGDGSFLAEGPFLLGINPLLKHDLAVKTNGFNHSNHQEPP